MDALLQPWPWYVVGPLLGLIVPLLLLAGGKQFGISTSFQDICAMTLPGEVEYFSYDWRSSGWRFAFVIGLFVGAVLTHVFLVEPNAMVAISTATVGDLEALGIRDFSGLVPSEFMSWGGLLTIQGFVMVVVGGFLVGFGARYADGCTSGHGIMGLANLQLSSLIALLGFFAGGLFVTHLVLPLLFGSAGS